MQDLSLQARQIKYQFKTSQRIFVSNWQARWDQHTQQGFLSLDTAQRHFWLA